METPGAEHLCAALGLGYQRLPLLYTTTGGGMGSGLYGAPTLPPESVPEEALIRAVRRALAATDDDAALG